MKCMFDTGIKILAVVAHRLGLLDWIPLLAVRVYLAIVFWQAGHNKWMYFDQTVEWFRTSLQLPLPSLMAHLATYTEILGAVCLLLGLAVRLISIPLIFTMLVAIFKVHLVNGWAAIAGSDTLAHKELEDFLGWLLMTHPEKYQSLTEHGMPIILNNGCEFAVTFLIMLMIMFWYGAGKFFSCDYWIKRKLKHLCPASHPH